jgi:hypothetical protein
MNTTLVGEFLIQCSYKNLASSKSLKLPYTTLEILENLLTEKWNMFKYTYIFGYIETFL